MDFRSSSEQDMLRDGARRFVGAKLDFDSRASGGASGDHWAEMAEMGWLMLPVPEAYDGLGGGIDEIALIAEELGRGLALEAYVEAGVLPAQLIALAAAPGQCAAILPELAMGNARVAVALYEPQRGFDLAPVETRAEPDHQNFRISGRKVSVKGGVAATHIILSANLAGEAALFLVPVESAGIDRIDYDAIDGRTLSDFTFTDVELEGAGKLAGTMTASAAIAQAVDVVIVAQCAEALGGIDRAIELTADYLKVRQQFGHPLADFQALQHGVADLFIQANDARSIVYRAMSMIDAPAAERARAVSACKVKVMTAARSIIGKAVHYHGGIGVTTEYSVGHHLRRALMLDQRFGTNAWHFECLVASAA